MNKKILIIYAVSGMLGHKVIGENYAALLRKEGFETQTADVYAIEGKAVVRGGNEIYFWALKHIPWLWRWLYKYWTYIPGASLFKDYFQPWQYPKSQKYILDYNPDLIITTHPSATTIVDYLKRTSRLDSKCKLLTTFSDWHTQPFHVYGSVDRYLVVVPEQIADLKKLGVPKEKVTVVGILVSEQYYNAPSKKEARKILGIDKKTEFGAAPNGAPHRSEASGARVILVMGGGKGWEIEQTILALQHLQSPAHTIIVGGNEDRKKKIESRIKNQESRMVAFQVTDFIEPSLYFAAADLLISKPGGLTTSQAFLLKTPLLATSPLPGQEDANIEYLLKKGAIALKNDRQNFTEQIDALLDNERQLTEITENAYKIAPRNAPQVALETIKAELYS